MENAGGSIDHANIGELGNQLAWKMYGAYNMPIVNNIIVSKS